MKLQGTIVIPDAKLTEYLLILRREDDKPRFLAQAGFTADNPNQLKKAILILIQTYDAISDRQNEYGTITASKVLSLDPTAPLQLLQFG